MSGERIDYGIERRRHEGFVGREALLSRLDQLLVVDDADRWVVVTGGPGMGKSALLAAWLARREAAGEVVPHHFIRRGQYSWDDPAKLVDSLVAQIEERKLAPREPEEDARRHPAARLAAILARVSASEPAPCGKRLVILIDGLDEYDPPAEAAPNDPLAAFLPHVLPRGTSFLCASRPRHPYVDALAARGGALAQLDLDERDLAPDNESTVRAFWERAAPELGLDARFVDEAVAGAGGNLQHAAMLRQHLQGLPAARRRVEDIPRGLAALLASSWQRIASEPIAVRGLGILCAAREALTLDEIGAVAGWTDEAPRQMFLRGARELLIETLRQDGQEEYRLHHDATGRTLMTLEGHTDSVRACAATADGGCVISASADRTLKVWDVGSSICLFTHRGDAAYTAVAATATTIVAGDANGAVWVLDWPSSSASSSPESKREAHATNESLPLRSARQKHTILFLAANPSETGRLAVDREARAIQKELESAGYRDCFEFETRWAAEPLDLLRELRRLKPTVVHFSGHGGPDIAGEHRPGPESRRDTAGALGTHADAQRHGLFFQGSDGRARFVSAQAIEQTFGATGSSVKLVVLSACYSEVQAEALLAHVDCIVGMSGSIHDAAARSFAIGFYGGLGERESVAAAYQQGRAAIRLEGLHDSDRPQLKVRAGVDASRLVLAADPP